MEGSSSQSDDSSPSLGESDSSNPPFKRHKSRSGIGKSPAKSLKKKKLRPLHQSDVISELLAIDRDLDTASKLPCELDLLGSEEDLSREGPGCFENIAESVRKSHLYPNCEIDEKNCLRPSEAMRLFQEMDAALNRGRAKKRKWVTGTRCKETRYRAFGVHAKSKSTEEIHSLTSSLPAMKGHRKTCDCFEYCECLGRGRCLVRSKSLNCLKFNEGIVNPGKLDHSAEKNSTQKTSDKWKITGCHSRQWVAQRGYQLHKECLHLGHCGGLLQATPSSANQICCCDNKVVYSSDVRPTTIQGVNPETFVDRKQNMKKWFGEFNHEQKNLILKEMLDMCDMPQIHLLSIKMEPRLHQGCPNNCEDIISWLPNHLSLYILSLLDPVSLCRCQSVCRAWKKLASEPCLWRRFCYQTMWQSSGSLQQKQLLNNMLPGGRILWKQVFVERFKLRNNWLKGRCNVRTFEGHTQGISCVQFDDTRIVSGSSDKTIKVWNIRTNTPLSVQTLVGHSGTVRCLHLDGNRLVSGSSDRTIKVWDLSTQQSWSSIACKVTMVGHQHTVRCLQVDDDKVISGSYDKTLKIWNVRTGQCMKTLRGHEGEVLCVHYDDSKILSGSVDKTIKIWNFEGECLKTLTGHHDAVTCLQFDTTRIVSGSLDCSLKFWDVNSCECLKTIDWKASEGHTRVVRCLQTDSWRVVSASDDKTLKIWSLETGKRLVTLRNHTDGVTCLQFNDSIIVSGSYDKTVKLWDFSCC